MSSVTQKKIRFSDYHPAPVDFLAEIIDGLSSTPKSIPPKFLYDEAGSRLFDQICDVPEYYLTRTETRILRQNAGEIARVIGQNCFLIEPGSGSSHKIRLLLEALKPSTYMPMDISKHHLLKSAQNLAHDYPWLDIHAACADFTTDLVIPGRDRRTRNVVFFPGSSIGNFERADAVAFLRRLGEMAGQDGGLLIGIDLKKDPAVLEAAYNDRQGITARFNKHLLERINQELGGDFDLSSFRHHAFYNEGPGRIEIHLVSTRHQYATVAGHRFEFSEGESIHTENSYKYTIDEFRKIAATAGFHAVQSWSDESDLFNVQYLEYSA